MSSAMLIDAVLLCGVHLGLTLYEAGTVSHRNIQSVFLRSLICSACVIIMWYLIGYGFAFGSGNSFVGNSDFAVTAKNEFSWWQIVVEGLKYSRVSYHGPYYKDKIYACVVLLISVLVYPLPSHWMKSSGGFLQLMHPMLHLQDGRATEGIGCIDSGGASQVHLIAGVMGVIGAIMIGPRMGRFTPDGTCSPKFLSINNPSLVYSGLSLAILSWLGFLSGAYSNSSTSSGRAFESSLIALSSGTLVGIFLSVYYLRCHSVGTVLKCAFAGLVSISASAPIIEPYFAIVVGVIGAGLCFAGSRLLLRLHIDDALDVSSVHGLSGMWGTLVPGLFSSEHYVRDLRSVNEFSGGGVLLGNGGSLLAAQTLALLLPLVPLV
ncbi:ammonium transporter [Guillardia theta CCMP2712]|uniref:Ammonium transporter n=1 Tax=Guillardia theta (strain CCMP2712) TaxID=905079 RepID=L1J0G2_GUITC|nr:ammonium transporter [Guillardia theta CCMP2712]EKX41634.1 ammonium transporter [Guillardia theta CCMP2712]|eukprot:XP_005828614.1 ammonium transporter [Guillardia theta CCMP2712]